MNKPAALKNIRIVLARPSHPGNIGATARAMKTMGLDQLWLVAPRAFPHADADARASGARDVLERARVCGTLAEALADCTLAVATSSRHRELRHETLDARAAAAHIVAAAATSASIVKRSASVRPAAALPSEKAIGCPDFSDAAAARLAAAASVACPAAG